MFSFCSATKQNGILKCGYSWSGATVSVICERDLRTGLALCARHQSRLCLVALVLLSTECGTLYLNGGHKTDFFGFFPVKGIVP